MSSWLKVSLMLCCFGFLKEIRPSEPFVTDYLIQPWRNTTIEELNRYIFPIGTYSSMAQLMIVLLITDFLRYKPIIITIGVTGIITWAMLLWTTSLLWSQIIQVSYAAYVSCEVAYFTYIYAKVSKDHYMAVTSHTRAALLAGKFMSGVIGQTLVQTQLMNIRQLNYITFGAQIAATVVAIMLPSAESSIYFNRIDSVDPILNNVQHTLMAKFKSAFRVISIQFRCAYSNQHVILWSIWYSLGVCGYFQVWSYVQMLWTAIDNDPASIWNGAVEAGTTLVCAGIALLASRLHADIFKTKVKLLTLLVVASSFLSCSILLMANTGSRYWSYVGYTSFYICYTFTVTIASAEIAKHLPDDSFGLIFGLNTFFALCLQSLLTMFVVSDVFGLQLNIFKQFNVYAGYFSALSAAYLLMLLIRLRRRRPREVTRDFTMDKEFGANRSE